MTGGGHSFVYCRVYCGHPHISSDMASVVGSIVVRLIFFVRSYWKLFFLKQIFQTGKTCFRYYGSFRESIDVMVLGVSSTIRFDQASLFFLRNQSTGFTWKISRILQPFKFTCSLFDWRALLIVGENKVHQVVVEDFLKLRGAIGSQGWYNFVAILNLGEFFGPPGHKKNRSQSFGRFFC